MAETTSTTAELGRLLSGSRLADLTLTMAENLPCWWPTHMPFQHKIWNWFEDRVAEPVSLHSRAGPYQTRWMALDEHTGTHFDAPAHFIPQEGSNLPNAGRAGSITGDRVPVVQFFGPARVFDARHITAGAGPGISPAISADHLRRWEHEQGEVQRGEVLLFWTAWDRFYKPGPEGSPYVENPLIRKSHPGWPAPDVSAAELLLDRGVRCMGTDAPSMGAAHDGGPVHIAALKEGAVFVEGLTNLQALPPHGAFFLFLPIKVRASTGGCGRAVAVLA